MVDGLHTIDGSFTNGIEAAKRLPLAEFDDATASRSMPRYTLVHLVTGETKKDLIFSQVVTPMVQQMQAPGPGRPARAVIIFLEPARVAVRPSTRVQVQAIRRQSDGVKVAVVPYISRLTRPVAARLAAPLLRRLTGAGAVVFHCRGEEAVIWAAHFAKAFHNCGIVADIRGARPEEVLASRGLADLTGAPPDFARDYDLQTQIVRRALSAASHVLTVSSGMVDWLRQLGVNDDRLTYVPACVPELRFSTHVRAEMRAELGVSSSLVYCFLGTAESYATIGDGIVPFLRASFATFADIRLLILTDKPGVLRDQLQQGGIPLDKAFIRSVRHSEVWKYLCAADCGCIMNRPGRLNKTWQPIKFGEYLAAGLPVVVSEGIGDVDVKVTRAGAGIVVQLNRDGVDSLQCEAERVHETLLAQGERMRQRALKLCEEEFLWARYIDKLRSAYVEALAG